ncbi:unnamed protein product [Trichobilharzia szidati]|nr:unnamed protein product [Trichobilharzia szidati]
MKKFRFVEKATVEYLFTDKTGTLTENSMQFRRLATAMGVFYFENSGLFRYTDTPPSTHINDLNFDKNTISREEQEELDDVSEAVQLKSASETDSQSPTVSSVQTLLLLLSLCHTVRVERRIPEEMLSKSTLEKLDSDKTPRRGSSALRRASAALAASAAFRASKRGRKVKTHDYEYQASSPDEKAFVETCRDLDIVYHGSDESGLLVITIHGEAVRYRLLDVLEFDPTRKCMSVVVQFVPKEGNTTSSTSPPPVLILCKGAETTLLAKVNASQQTTQFPSYGDPLGDSFCGPYASYLRMDPEQVMKQVTEFATLGLRTLVMGVRLVTFEQWTQLKQQLDTARGMMDGRQKELTSAYNDIESKLTLIGCTGIEDMLQDGVPDTIKALREAGIKVWVLTGDKEETAVNISYLAGHFYPGMQEVRITKFNDMIGCGGFLKSQIERIKESKEYHPEAQFGVVIDGQSLNYALVEPVRSLLLQCCLESTTVLCCRLTPLQKAEVVRLIKESRKSSVPITAAIGDGANDVSMIQEAHIGFGIYGKEGRQAVRAADYAFGRFHFLKNVILVHGHNFYLRVSLLVMYFFYKNIIFTLPQMLYGFFCAYSQQSVYPQLYLLFFNLTMTSLPILLYGIFEVPVPESTLLEFPVLYKGIAKNAILSKERFIFWIGLACWHAFVAFFGAYFLTFQGQGNDNGNSALGDIVCFGNFIVILVFIIVNIKVLLMSYYLNWIVLLLWNVAFFSNFGAFLICNVVLFPATIGKQLFGSFTIMYAGSGAGVTWFGTLCLVLLALLPDFIIRTVEDQGWQWRLTNLQEERRKKLRGSKVQQRTSVRISIMSKQIDETEENNDQDEGLYDYTNPIFYELPNWQIEDKLDHTMPVYTPDSVSNGPTMTNPQYPTTKSIKNGDFYNIPPLNNGTATKTISNTTTNMPSSSMIDDPQKHTPMKVITMPDAMEITDSTLNVPSLYGNNIDPMANSALTKF